MVDRDFALDRSAHTGNDARNVRHSEAVLVRPRARLAKSRSPHQSTSRSSSQQAWRPDKPRGRRTHRIRLDELAWPPTSAIQTLAFLLRMAELKLSRRSNVKAVVCCTASNDPPARQLSARFRCVRWRSSSTSAVSCRSPAASFSPGRARSFPRHRARGELKSARQAASDSNSQCTGISNRTQALSASPRRASPMEPSKRRDR